MIWHWLHRAWRYIIWLTCPPEKRDVARINVHAPCPVCGHQDGTIRTVATTSAAGAPPQNDGPVWQRQAAVAKARILCEHTCAICGARFYEAPIVAGSATQIWPSVARTELEKKADNDRVFRAIVVNQELDGKTARAN